ncbi:HAD-IIA family hydrolase [Corynebacterium accolens]|uniref:HAD-IIA family hydrolase n=1 Tax=Corynebacterium accolens TaxID=38284 RepID=UPI002543F9FF|nr:HAD-IIA family hydrolase [Corynebacterium accolens]MDK4233611.1 HAD-IIA family hydrolase [Corynebacterium accolens]MDK4276589.1 HAD-IIA family hydrolase [Corynebacterium accolens]
MSVLSKHDALLLDLDGTVWEGGRPLSNVVDVINTCGVPAVYVTNNASRSPEAVATMLTDIGLTADSGDIVTSAQAVLQLAAEEIPSGAKVLIIGADSFRNLAKDMGFSVVSSADDKPAAVLQGFDKSVGWEQLTEGALAIRAGAKYFASNLDTSLPIERGLGVGNGSLVAAVQKATGVEPVSAGKPEPAMFFLAAKKVGSKKPLAVGDRLDTDIVGGNTAAMNTFHVLTGVSGELELIEAPVEARPNFIGAGMHELSLPISQVRPGPQGDFTARCDGYDVLLQGGNESSTSVQALRTVLEVAWSMPAPPRYIQPRSEFAEKVVSKWR